jgi:hypothetical protein
MAEKALGLASSTEDRIVALEQVGLVARDDYRGDLAWRSLKEAVDLRLANAPDDRRAIAIACAWALENPLRWPGSMRDFPDVEEVRRYLEIGFSHLDADDSEDAIRLLTLRAFEPFGFGWRIPIDPDHRERSLESGIRAAELARRIGRVDLESAALDGASSAIIGEGLYGQPRYLSLQARRLEIAEVTEDPWELGDIYAMSAWTRTLLGNYEEALAIGLRGAERAEGAEGLIGHCLNWVCASLFHLGEWDRVLDAFDRIRSVMEDRVDEPPYFMLNAFGAAAFVHDARGLDGTERWLSVLEGSRGRRLEGSVVASYWLAWMYTRRGEHERAWSILGEATTPIQTVRPIMGEGVSEVLSVTGRWHEVPSFLERERAYAEEARLLALPVYLDRLEGRAALASGRSEDGRALLVRARDGFGRLGAVWERARTELDLAEALAESGASSDARSMADAAAPDLRRVGALLELDRLQVLRTRLG